MPVNICDHTVSEPKLPFVKSAEQSVCVKAEAAGKTHKNVLCVKRKLRWIYAKTYP